MTYKPESMKQEPVAWVDAKEEGYEFYGISYLPVGKHHLYAAPVDMPQGEPTSVDAKAIGLAIHYPDCWDTAVYPTLDSALAEIAAWGNPFRCTNDDCVDAKAIRAEALEEAVKFLEENGMIAPNGFTAAGIRGLK